jgi:glycosyltransferase involved in cell wall biosynthesis
VNEDVLRVIPHGAFDYYSEFVGAADVRGPDSRVHLVFAGSIKSYKGLDVLVESLPTLAAATPNGAWHLTIAGQPGIPIAPLAKTIRDYGLGENVTWSLRHQSERELGRLLGAADVVVLPYREIDQSGVLLAAVGVKRPVVATRVGAFPELLRHETHGLLVSPEDPLELGRALARLVVDSPLRTYCQGQMQHLASGELNWATIGHKTLNLYKELART